MPHHLCLKLVCVVQLVGYYAAANMVDYRWVGRRRLTVFSFIMVAAIFAAVAGAYDHLVDRSHRKNIHVFQFLYYISSFFGLFGSHTTSFLLSAEVSRCPQHSLMQNGFVCLSQCMCRCLFMQSVQSHKACQPALVVGSSDTHLHHATAALPLLHFLTSA